MYVWYVMFNNKIPNMKRIIFILFIAFLSLTGFAQTGARFMDNSPWKEVLKRAKRENKMIFVDCYTSWCGPCKQLAKQIFPQEKMGEYLNARFVNVKYDVEKGEGLAIEKMYPGEVKVYPTMLILNAKGELLHKVTGMHPADELIAAIAEGLQGNTIYVLEKEFEKGNREKEFILKYLYLLKASSERKQYEKVARAYASQFPVDSLLNKEIWSMVNKFIAKYPYDKEFRFIIEHLDEMEVKGLIDRYALESELSGEIGFAVNSIYLLSNQTHSEDSVALLQKQADYLRMLLQKPVKGFPESLAELSLVECKLAGDADRLYDRFCVLTECGLVNRDVFQSSMLQYLVQRLNDAERLRHCVELARQLKTTSPGWMQSICNDIIESANNKLK